MPKANIIQSYLERGRELKEKLARREELVGLFVKSYDPAATEIIARCEPDFLIADMEHRPCSPEALGALILAARCYLVPMLVRVDETTPAAINRALDLGALGIVAPDIVAADNVTNIVRAMRYKGGDRGFSPSVAANGYGALSPGAYKDLADSALTLLTQIESWGGVQNASAIAGVEGVDGIFIGPVDLAHSLENTSDKTPTLQEATAIIAERCQAANRAVGVFDAAPSNSSLAATQGVSFIVTGTDFSLLETATVNALQRGRRRAPTD